MIKKRILSILLAISVSIGVCSLPVVAKDEAPENENVAYAIMGKKLKTKNFSIFRVGAQADVKQISERSGEECWIIDKAYGWSSDKICMVLDEKFKSGIDAGDAFEVEVDYFDVGAGGFFFLGYDPQRPLKQNEGIAMAGEIVYTQGTNKWKTATFRIDDADFNRTLEGGCDLYIGTRRSDALNNAMFLSEIPIPFKEVRITKIPGVNPVRNIVTTDHFGNAYAWYAEDKIIHNKFTNLLEKPAEFDVTFELINGDGYLAYSKTEKISFDAGEMKDIDFNFGEFDRCDRYGYYVTVENKELGIYSRIQYSIVAIIKADPDGKLNSHMNFCGPLYSSNSATPIENYRLGLDLMKLGGFSGSRYDEGWYHRDPSGGTFDTNTKQDAVLKETAERGLSVLPICFLGNQNITGSWNIMPTTEKQMALAEVYIDKFIKYLSDKTDLYEAWNEPDHKNFAQNFTPENYVRLYKIFDEKIKKYDPGAKMGYLCYASAHSTIQHDWTTEMFDLGLAEMIRGNAITFHGYPGMPSENWLSKEKIDWYVEELERYGVSRDEYEIWTTEFGGTVAERGTRRRQGAVTIREVLLQRMEHHVDRFYIYRFEDPGELTYRREASFGHVSSINGYAYIYGQLGVPWESFIMDTAYNYLFADSEPVSYIHKGDDTRLYLFDSQKFGKKIIAMNAMTGVETVTLDLGVNEVQYFDEYGNERKLSSDNGIYTLAITDYPTYIMGDFKNPKKLENSDAFTMEGYFEAVSGDVVTITVNNNTQKEYTAIVEATGSKSRMDGITIKPGENKIEYFNDAPVGKEYELRLIVKDGDKTVSVLPVQIKSVFIAVTQMSLELKSPKNFNKWNGVARISNSSATRVIKGKFEVIGPEKFKTKKPIDVTFVPRKTTAEISFDLPEISKKQIYTFEYKLTLDSGEVIFGESKADTTCAAYASQKPTIDGKIDSGEWNLQTLMQVSSLENVVYVQNWKGKTWQGASDQSAKAYAMWDEENIYFCWDVTDDKFYQDQEDFYTWQGDSIQFGVYMGSGDEYIALGEANQNFTEIGIAKTPKGCQAYRYGAQDSNKHQNGLVPEDDYDLAIEVDGNRTVYELAMKWSSLLPDGITPKANTRLGFSFIANENDGEGRQGAIIFAGGIFFNKNSAEFTYINLIGEN